MYRTDTGQDGAAFSGPQKPAPFADLDFQAAMQPRPIKRCLDIVAALVFFVVFLPLLVVLAIAVWLSSPGPIIYVQKRVGRRGKPFSFYKFRSMRTRADEVLTSFLDSDAEARRQWEQYQKLDPDPRVTPFGRFIRRTSLDELPQFWNVLRGDMSLVGPRPVTSAERWRYGSAWGAYCSVRPGLTGIWQVSGRSNVTYEQRVQMDVQYVMTQSIYSDLMILIRTFKVVLGMEGSR